MTARARVRGPRRRDTVVAGARRSSIAACATTDVPGQTFPAPSIGPGMTVTAAVNLTRGDLVRVLGDEQLVLTDSQSPVRPSEAPLLAAAPRAVYQVILRRTRPRASSSSTSSPIRTAPRPPRRSSRPGWRPVPVGSSGRRARSRRSARTGRRSSTTTGCPVRPRILGGRHGGISAHCGYPDRGGGGPERLEQLRPVEARVFGPCHDGDRCTSHTVAARSAAASATKIPASIAWNVQN